MLTASYVALGSTAVFYHIRYNQLRQTYEQLDEEYKLLNQTYVSLRLFDHSGHPPSPSAISTEVPQILITHPAGFQEYATAILKVCHTALLKYTRVFGMSSPNIHVFIYTNASKRSLSTTPANYRVYLYIQSIKDLEEPTKSHLHHVYGFIHEIGHIMFMTDNNIFNEGWANYAAGFRIVSEVYHDLGDDVWPQPYNYSRIEGRERFLNEINNASLSQPNTFYAASKILYTIDLNYGPRIFKYAVDRLHPSEVGMYGYPIYSLEDFKNSLVELTNDTTILKLFSENGF